MLKMQKCGFTASFLWQFFHILPHFQPQNWPFFPSCASVALARSSHLVVLIERIGKCIHYIPLWGFESGAKITSKWCQFQNKTANQNTKTRKTPKPKTEQNNHKTQGRNMAWRLQSATASSASELKDLAHQTKKKTNQKDNRARSREGIQQTHHPAVPKPGVPYQIIQARDVGKTQDGRRIQIRE